MRNNYKSMDSSTEGSALKRRFVYATRHWRAWILLAVIWVLLWGELTWGNVIIGFVLGWIVLFSFPMPSLGYSGRIHVVHLVKLGWYFMWNVVVASFQIAFFAINPRKVPRGAVIGVQLQNGSDVYMAMVAEISSLIPGTMVIETHRHSGVLYIHVFDVDLLGGIDAARKQTQDVEVMVLKAFASSRELREWGLSSE